MISWIIVKFDTPFIEMIPYNNWQPVEALYQLFSLKIGLLRKIA